MNTEPLAKAQWVEADLNEYLPEELEGNDRAIQLLIDMVDWGQVEDNMIARGWDTLNHFLHPEDVKAALIKEFPEVDYDAD